MKLEDVGDIHESYVKATLVEELKGNILNSSFILTSPIKPKKKKSNLLVVSFIVTFLFLFFCLLSVGILFLLVDTEGRNNFLQNLTIPPISANVNSNYRNLISEICDEKENVLSSKVPLAAYDMNEFYAGNVSTKQVAVIPVTETLFLDHVVWDNVNIDGLAYKGKAQVCIKGQNKVATIEFTTQNSTFLNPVRYKDPERQIKNILIQAFYAVPVGSSVNSDWKTKMTSNLIGIQKAQNRIFNGKSNIDFQIYPVPVDMTSINRDFLTTVARGIIAQNKSQNSSALLPRDFLSDNLYTDANQALYPSFFNKAIDGSNIKDYDQITSLVFLEVGNSKDRSINQSKRYESGFAFISPAMNNGNYFGIIGVDFRQDLSNDAASYHEFMHTLGLPDEYKYDNGKAQRDPAHLFKGMHQELPTLMEDPYYAGLNKTYIDDQERVMMGIID